MRLDGLIAEYFRDKGLDGCAFLPCVEGQPGLAAGLLEESGAIPFVFDGDLGQEQAAAAVLSDEETVASDFDFFGVNRLRGRENAELDFEMRSFVRGYGRKAVVVESGGTRGFRDSTIDRTGGKHIANASAQLSKQIERSESAARFGEVRSRGIERNLAALQRGGNGIVRQAKQEGALFRRKFLGGDFRGSQNGRRIML